MLWPRSFSDEQTPKVIESRCCSTAVLLAVLAWFPVHSSVAQEPARLSLPDGRKVEVLGLGRRTLSMLQDSLAKYAPGDSLTSHARAAWRTITSVLSALPWAFDAGLDAHLWRGDSTPRGMRSRRH